MMPDMVAKIPEKPVENFIPTIIGKSYVTIGFLANMGGVIGSQGKEGNDDVE